MTHARAKVLFVSYGSGHVRMVVPVARALQSTDWAQSTVLGLTTAAAVVRDAGLPLLQFKDFVTDDDALALDLGRLLLDEAGGGVIDAQESVAYLGLSFADLVQQHGLDQARALYRQKGRHAFLPVTLLERILRRVAPDVVVTTNSPRSECAAVLAARNLGIPAVCLVDLFGVDEMQRLVRPEFADAICVLNDNVRRHVIAAGRDASQVHATGNPAFDALQEPALATYGKAMREKCGWTGQRVMLWPTQVYPAFHPSVGLMEDVSLPQRVLDQLVRWTLDQSGVVLCVRPRAGEDAPNLPGDPRIVVTGQEWPLGALLHAVDLVVTLNSTVGLEGHLAGTRLVQVLGTPFDDSMPLLANGIADAAVHLHELLPVVDHWIGQPRRQPGAVPQATPLVVEVIARLCGRLT